MHPPEAGAATDPLPTPLPMDTGIPSTVESINFTTISPSGRFASMVARPFTLRFPKDGILRTGPAIGFDSRAARKLEPCGLASAPGGTA